MNVIDPNMTSKSCFSLCWGGGGTDGAAEMFANRVKKRSMDASHATSVAVKQARAVAASTQSGTIVHLCPRCVLPRIVVGHVWALLSDSRPGSKNRPGIT